MCSLVSAATASLTTPTFSCSTFARLARTSKLKVSPEEENNSKYIPLLKNFHFSGPFQFRSSFLSLPQLHLANVTVKYGDGKEVPVEDIISAFPQYKMVQVDYDPPERKISCLYRTPDALNRGRFCEYLNGTNAEVVALFLRNLTPSELDAYQESFDRLVNELVKPGSQLYRTQFIRFAENNNLRVVFKRIHHNRGI